MPVRIERLANVNLQTTVHDITREQLADVVDALSAGTWRVTVEGMDGRGLYKVTSRWTGDPRQMAMQLDQLDRYTRPCTKEQTTCLPTS